MAKKAAYEDIHISEVCRKVKISKVTFFKYFNHKEDLLRYFFKVWYLQRSLELADKPKEGKAGIFFLFEKMAETILKYRGIPESYAYYLSRYEIPPKPITISLFEKKVLFPQETGLENIEIVTIPQMLENFVLEAIFRKEITKTSDIKQITNLLLGFFFGSSFVITIRKIAQPKLFYRKNLQLIFDGLK